MLSEEKAIIEVRKLRDANKRNSLGKSIETVLNLITKLQKEKEDLLREKEENKFIIAMANNEMLGYNQGYSDAENKNSNATEIVIKHRQAYMHKEEVEFYKRKIEFLKKENEEKDKQIDLSAEFIKNNMSEKKIINEICIKGKCNNEECHEDDLKECIKLHFEKLAKEKGE